MGRIVGIDLGTSQSCIGVLEDGLPVLIPNAAGRFLTPSVVRFLPDGGELVGERASTARAIDPENTIISVKRLMGRRYHEIFDLIPITPYSIAIGENNLAMIESHGRTHTPQYVSALVLKSLRQDAERYLGESVKDAIICVPAYFNTLQREATRQAGIIAGWNVVRIIHEPTAASLLLPAGSGRGQSRRIAVCDLGGGTFDVSILEIGEGVCEVQAIAGDNQLGGDDFDERIVQWMRAECLLRLGRPPASKPVVWERLRTGAIEAKHLLSASPVAPIDLPHLELEGGGLGHLECTLTRAFFEELCAELFERLREPCESALRSLYEKSLDGILLVGGATRMTRVRTLVQEALHCNSVRSIRPDETVALGAAMQGGVLEGRLQDLLLLDQTWASVGVETSDGLMCSMIDRNTTIPTRKTDDFSTAMDNQASVEIRILEGEQKYANDNRTIARLVLEGLPPLPKAIVQVRLTFDIDADQSLTVTTLEPGTGKKSTLRVRAQTGLPEDRVSLLARSLAERRL